MTRIELIEAVLHVLSSTEVPLLGREICTLLEKSGICVEKRYVNSVLYGEIREQKFATRDAQYRWAILRDKKVDHPDPPAKSGRTKGSKPRRSRPNEQEQLRNHLLLHVDVRTPCDPNEPCNLQGELETWAEMLESEKRNRNIVIGLNGGITVVSVLCTIDGAEVPALVRMAKFSAVWFIASPELDGKVVLPYRPKNEALLESKGFREIRCVRPARAMILHCQSGSDYLHVEDVIDHEKYFGICDFPQLTSPANRDPRPVK